MKRLIPIVLCLGVTGVAQAKPTSASFRRPEVRQLFKGSKPYTMTTTAIKSTAKGLVLAAQNFVATHEDGTGYKQFKWVLVPFKTQSDVRALSSAEARKLGLRTLSDAKKLAIALGDDALFAKGQPLKNVTFRYTTTGHNKHAGSARSFVFSANLSKPVNGRTYVNFTVPLEVGKGTQTAF